jgi:hypothetical protein
MLYSERKRLAALVAKEKAGENIWSLDLPSPFREKLIDLVRSYVQLVNPYSASIGLEDWLTAARSIILHETGTRSLEYKGSAVDDFIEHIRKCDSDNFPDVLESLISAFRFNEYDKAKSAIKNFENDINRLLGSYRIAYSVENGEVVTFNSRELHKEIVIPALRLLTQSGWESVEKAYQDGLKELASGKPDNAITDATTALQEGLRKLGCKGDNFADLLKSAKNTILKGYDSKYVEGIDSLISWASATRANKGDSHKVTTAEKNDAWFVIHVVGVLLLRLSKFKDE